MKKNLLTLMTILALPLVGMAQFATVSGVVMGANGPTANADVNAYSSSPFSLFATTTTNEAGEFYFDVAVNGMNDFIYLEPAACPGDTSGIYINPNDSIWILLACPGNDMGLEALFLSATPLNDAGTEWYFHSSVFGEVESYAWSIEGQTYTTPDVNHTFEQSGGHFVSLTTLMSGGNSLFGSIFLQVLDSLYCQASFYPMVDTTSAAEGIVFVNASYGNNLTYFWDFGDGATSTDPYPTYIFSDSLAYEVCLTVSSASCENTFCMTVSLDMMNIWTGSGIAGLIENPNLQYQTQAKSSGFEFRVISLQGSILSTAERSMNIELGVFPNPSDGNFTINLETKNPETGAITIFDMNGRSVYQQMAALSQGPNTFNLDLNQLPSGVYILSFNGAMNVGMRKLVVRH
jgi:PKD repeat protein